METSDTLTSLEFILNILGFMPRRGSECMEMRSWYERGQGAGQVPRKMRARPESGSGMGI